MINFRAPYLSPRATMVPLSCDIVTKKMSIPQLKTHISEPFFIRQSRMVPSLEPETTISLSGEMDEHQTWRINNQTWRIQIELSLYNVSILMRCRKMLYILLVFILLVHHVDTTTHQWYFYSSYAKRK